MACATTPASQSPPGLRFRSPLVEPSVRISRTWLSLEIVPSLTRSCTSAPSGVPSRVPLLRKHTGFSECMLCCLFSSAREALAGGFDRNGREAAAGHDRTGRFSLAPTAHCVPKGREDSIWRARWLRPRPHCPDRDRRTTPSPGVRSAARLGRSRSGLRWPTHALLGLRASEGKRAMAPSVTLS